MGDGMRLTRAAYLQVIADDLAWLDKMPGAMERGHVRMIVERSAELEYDLAPLLASVLSYAASRPPSNFLRKLNDSPKHIALIEAVERYRDTHGARSVPELPSLPAFTRAYVASANQPLIEAIRGAITLSRVHSESCLLVFNDTAIPVEPSDTTDDVAQRWELRRR